jgi:hypothetical protein
MAIARPKRLTTVITDPLILPMPPAQSPTGPAKEEVALDGEVMPTEPQRPRVVVQEVSPKDDSSKEDLSAVRLRPRRVIVIK